MIIQHENRFGNLTGEFLLGLGKINCLTKEQSNTLRVDFGDFDGNTNYAQYTTFSVGNSTTKYTLTVGGYSGITGDDLAYQKCLNLGYTSELLRSVALMCSQITTIIMSNQSCMYVACYGNGHSPGMH